MHNKKNGYQRYPLFHFLKQKGFTLFKLSQDY